ncbi:putative glycoside hydrolase family 61 protein [Botrytis fragariae]|uniref:AA9 family lytic polysaccharide monooxygenase n=1 Tax=Botrytis fragariae TaxID=1964551 RepID=A0A8H6AP70_9HELO|nr:putative glycoside hydrolase family 61 protein [Botrytis fragariae]KAF5870958.1 putative glycoside hydrolase family 61 protein [Botrytis fragariae]
MKSLVSLLGFSFLTCHASAHYIFQSFTYKNIQYPPYGYIRMNDNYNSPVTDLASNDLRCNSGGETSNGAQTITVKAGDSFSFTADIQVYHQGPLSIYMAKAPTTAAAFDGSGQVWFKILDIGPTFTNQVATWNLYQTYTYTIPPNLPNGDYLLRIQQLAIHNPYPGGIPQFYIECAQITVTNGGTGTPGPLVSIPGAFSVTDPGYTANIYSNFFNYTVPGPAVWASQGGSSAYAGISTGNNAATTLASMPAGTGAATTASVTATATGTLTTTTKTATLTTTTKTATSATATATGSVVQKFGQCGGQGWTGGTVCAAGSTCTASSVYYSQCL